MDIFPFFAFSFSPTLSSEASALSFCSASLIPAYKSGSATFSRMLSFGRRLYCWIYILIVLCYDKKRGDIMRIQKCYIGYCAITWLLWITTLVLVPISGGAFDVHNEALYHFVNKLSNISVLISWLPVHPVLFILSLVSSIKNKRKGYIAFNIFSILFTTILAFAILGFHVWLIGGV